SPPWWGLQVEVFWSVSRETQYRSRVVSTRAAPGAKELTSCTIGIWGALSHETSTCEPTRGEGDTTRRRMITRTPIGGGSATDARDCRQLTRPSPPPSARPGAARPPELRSQDAGRAPGGPGGPPGRAGSRPQGTPG